jgi:hypothetical protein
VATGETTCAASPSVNVRVKKMASRKATTTQSGQRLCCVASRNDIRLKHFKMLTPFP